VGEVETEICVAFDRHLSARIDHTHGGRKANLYASVEAACCFRGRRCDVMMDALLDTLVASDELVL
jgi:hypothetical protein